MPLYDQLQEEQRNRREHVHQLTRDYLSSISKPFGFDSREKAKIILRRHSYSGGDLLRRQPQFKANPLPDFYHQKSDENEQYDLTQHYLFVADRVFLLVQSQGRISPTLSQKTNACQRITSTIKVTVQQSKVQACPSFDERQRSSASPLRRTFVQAQNERLLRAELR